MGLLNQTEIANMLLYLKDKECADNDNIRYKEIIKGMLCNDVRVLEVLNNKDLEQEIVDNGGEIDGSIYLGKNILGNYILPNTQTNIQNYICIDCSFEETVRYNATYKVGQIIFYILCDVKNNDYHGISRHDLLGHLILDLFNWSNVLDTQIHIVSDKSSVTDLNYATRTMVFEYTKPNSILQSRKNSNNKIENKVINQNKGL